MGGNTDVKNVPFINSLKGNSGAHYNYIGQANVSSMILYLIFMGTKFHNLGLGPKA